MLKNIRKPFRGFNAVLLSEKPLESQMFEERLSALFPAAEVSLDSFEEYLPAYEHCSNLKTVGLIILFAHETSTLPVNAISELTSPFEALGSQSGLWIVADSEKSFTSSYKQYSDHPGLLKISLVSDLSTDSALKSEFENILDMFSTKQVEGVLSQDEIELFDQISGKFVDISLLHRITQLITTKLDQDWLDQLTVRIGPAILGIPQAQKWILQNSPGAARIEAKVNPYLSFHPSELVERKDSHTVVRAVLLAYKIFQAHENGEGITLLQDLTKDVTPFSPTLAKVLKQTKLHILQLLRETEGRRVA